MARLQQYPLRFEPEERAAWQAAADKAGLPLAKWIRAACNIIASQSRGPTTAVPGVWEQVEGAFPYLPPDAISPEARRQVEEAMRTCRHPKKRPGASGLLKCVDCGEVLP